MKKYIRMLLFPCSSCTRQHCSHHETKVRSWFIQSEVRTSVLKSNPMLHVLLEVSDYKRVPFLRFCLDSVVGVCFPNSACSLYFTSTPQQLHSDALEDFALQETMSGIRQAVR
jgi:hypothetical protein